MARTNSGTDSFGLISIIMAAYNAEKTIAQAVGSVLDQTYQNWELLVINDCSEDSTVAAVKEAAASDPRIRIIENDRNRGVSYTRKRGAELATGSWTAILDSDDAWEPDKLEKQILLQQRTGATLLFTGSSFMDEHGKRLTWTLHAPLRISYRKLLRQNLVSNSSVLVRTALYRKYYSEGDNMHEDFATWLRITRTGRDAYGVDEPLLIYRLSPASKSGNKMKAFVMNWNTYRYVGLNPAAASYYMIWYTLNGLLKYRNLRSAGS